jgi:methionyl aminopeptidase
MSIESPADMHGLRRVGRIVRLTLDALERHVRPGISTGELDRLASRVVEEHGAHSAPALVYGFPGTVLISVNEEVVHGIPGVRRLARGDLVKLDVTLEKDGYVADAARTVLVESGTQTARRLKACVEAAFDAALTVACAGTRVNEIGRTIETVVGRHGFAVVRGLAGHGIGRTIHEPPSVPNEYDSRQMDVMTEGLVMTIEPMISAGSGRPVEDSDGWTIRTADRSWAAHHEHTLVITDGRPLILTGGAAS